MNFILKISNLSGGEFASLQYETGNEIFDKKDLEDCFDYFSKKLKDKSTRFNAESSSDPHPFSTHKKEKTAEHDLSAIPPDKRVWF